MKSILTFLVLAMILNLSCQRILFNEDEGTREITLQDFHAVRVLGIYNIVLIQDSLDLLTISGKNDINSIDAFIEDDTLVIDDHKKRSFNPGRNTLTLHFSNLSFMEFFDPVNLSNPDTIKSDDLTFIASGEIAEVRLVLKCNHFTALNNSNTIGYLRFIGEAGSCWFWNRYGSCMYADSLISREVVVYNESIGDVHVNASDHILAFIRGPGNIYYYGSPVINIIEKKGTGTMIRL